MNAPLPARAPHLVLAAPTLLAVLALTGCGGGLAAETGDTSGGSAPGFARNASSTAESDLAEIPEAPSTTDDETAPAPETQPDDQSDAEGSVDDESDFPDVVVPVEQGATYGVVVLSDGDEAALTASQEDAAAYDFEAYTAEIGCLQGAGPALGIADGTIVSYLVFGDIDAAQDFSALYTYLDDDAEVVGAVEAQTYCVDG